MESNFVVGSFWIMDSCDSMLFEFTNNNPTDTAIITVFGAVLGWIFQDTIKSVAAFFIFVQMDCCRLAT